MSRFAKCFVLCVLVAAFAVSLQAYPISPTSYSMLNGINGVYSGTDNTYLPCVASDCTTAGAALSGGLGELRDGNAPSLSWYGYGYWDGVAGPHWPTPVPGGLPGAANSFIDNQWVAFHSTTETIDFYFAPGTVLTEVSLYMDDPASLDNGQCPGTNCVLYMGPNIGNVFLPSNFSVNGVNYSTINIVDTATGPGWLNDFVGGINGIDLGPSGKLEVILTNRAAADYMMLGEVTFQSPTAPVPEPATFGLIAAGLFAIGYARRRRQQQ